MRFLRSQWQSPGDPKKRYLIISVLNFIHSADSPFFEIRSMGTVPSEHEVHNVSTARDRLEINQRTRQLQRPLSPIRDELIGREIFEAGRKSIRSRRSFYCFYFRTKLFDLRRNRSFLQLSEN
jgi:hypothetical protein